MSDTPIKRGTARRLGLDQPERSVWARWAKIGDQYALSPTLTHWQMATQAAAAAAERYTIDGNIKFAREQATGR